MPTEATSSHSPPFPVLRSIRKPISFEELSFQRRSIRVEDRAVAARPVGAAGTELVVVAVASLEAADSPVALNALTV